MRIKDRVLTPPRPSKITFFREDEQGNPANIEFTCGAVLDYRDFDSLCPRPKPPLVTKRDGSQYHDDTDKKYLQRLQDWSDAKIDWLVIQSLRSTEGLEWDTVDYKDPQTWSKYENELRTILTEGEYNRLFNAVIEANSPSSNRRSEALNVFTPSQVPEVGATNSQVEEPTTTTSSVPANG
jgi:hypothetical protein